MNVDEYQKQAMKTCMPQLVGDELYAACSLAEEAGEFMKLVRKENFHNKKVDISSKLEELGDIAWHLAHACDALQVPLSSVLQRNLDKLAARHGAEYKASHYTGPTDR